MGNKQRIAESRINSNSLSLKEQSNIVFRDTNKKRVSFRTNKPDSIY